MQLGWPGLIEVAGIAAFVFSLVRSIIDQKLHWLFGLSGIMPLSGLSAFLIQKMFHIQSNREIHASQIVLTAVVTLLVTGFLMYFRSLCFDGPHPPIATSLRRWGRSSRSMQSKNRGIAITGPKSLIARSRTAQFLGATAGFLLLTWVEDGVAQTYINANCRKAFPNCDPSIKMFLFGDQNNPFTFLWVSQFFPMLFLSVATMMAAAGAINAVRISRIPSRKLIRPKFRSQPRGNSRKNRRPNSQKC